MVLTQGPVPSCPVLMDFVSVLPVELSVRIFLVLDPLSLLTAAQSCSLWNRTINHSWNIWKHHCCSLCCRTHVDKDRQDGYSWKLHTHTHTHTHTQFVYLMNFWNVRNQFCFRLSQVTLLRNFHRSVLKRDWLSGRYSDVSSADELRDVTMISLDAESWGEILQAELDR
ncbi:F-box only protein 48 [Gouania willdenowi]|uniref:F-box only protein 48 n=1 Tax=Gouania willdenowi TaxID=441366 RepID=UPI001054B977|nr:F-box only protein 48 [Gouania willdenowi]